MDGFRTVEGINNCDRDDIFMCREISVRVDDLYYFGAEVATIMGFLRTGGKFLDEISHVVGMSRQKIVRHISQHPGIFKKQKTAVLDPFGEVDGLKLVYFLQDEYYLWNYEREQTEEEKQIIEERWREEAPKLLKLYEKRRKKWESQVPREKELGIWPWSLTADSK